MQLTLVLVIGIISVVATSAVAERIGVAAPLGLVVLGIGLSYLPGVHVDIDPELVLGGILPPLLYASATRMPGHDFRRNFRPIFGLAVYLVALTTIATGYLVDALLGVGLAAAFALGAVISPTDAVAATSIGSKLGLPTRLTTILEGEGLVNDASALVLLASASTAITHDTHVWRVGVDFVYSVAVATAVGLVVGAVGIWARTLLSDAVSVTAISFVVPYLAFLPAEEFNASGVLAVVVAGLVSGTLGPRHISAQNRLTESVNWRTVAFLLEGGIFLTMGLQLEPLWDADRAAGSAPLTAIWVGLLVSVVAMALRVVFTAPVVARLRRDAAKAERDSTRLDALEERVGDPEMQERLSPKRLAQFQKRVTTKRADIGFALTERFGWRGGGVLAWSGMRGAVTVAAAQTLPESTPHRSQLVLIAFTVAVVTLLVQGLSLPLVIRVLNVPGDDPEADRSAYTDLLDEISAAGVQVLDDDVRTATGEPFAPEVVDRIRTGLRLRPTDKLRTFGARDETAAQYLELLTTVLAAERTAMLRARSEGRYSSRVIGRAENALDQQESALQRVPLGGSAP